MAEPEILYTKPTPHSPDSPLPILIYRNVFSPDDDTIQEQATTLLEANQWLKGGKWGHIPTPHYHSNTHECYAAIRGHTRCRYGAGPFDGDDAGVEFELRAGDVAVHAAGVVHRNSGE